jgi:hypothetical protein
VVDGVELVLGEAAEVIFTEVAVSFTPPHWFPFAPLLTDVK